MNKQALSTFLAILLTTLLSVTLLAACSSDPKKNDPYQDKAAYDIFSTGETNLKKGYYTDAVQAFESLDAQFPVGEYTEQAHLEMIYAYYRADDYTGALSAAERFIHLHPRSPNIDYAYYMKGIIKMHENQSALLRFLPIEKSDRDISSEKQSFEYFKELTNRYPDSTYSPDARQRMIALRNKMAQHELTIAKYYLQRKAYLAAANRAREIVEQFDQTPAVYDALEIMVKSYRELDLDDLAKEAAAIQVANRK